MKKSALWIVIGLLVTASMVLSACQPAAPPAEAPVEEMEVEEAAPVEEEAPEEEPEMEATPTSQFMSMGDMQYQLELMSAEPVNPDAPLWEQMLDPDNKGFVDTSGFQKDPPWHVCFSNASIANSWRVVGNAAMEYEVSQHPEIETFTVTDAQENPEKQISDIEDLLTKDCDILIVSPATTEALTPAVEKAAATGIPVVVFDRGVNTEDYTSFIHPIGGFAFGFAGAQWLADAMGGEGNVLAIRILPGVDVLETRWLAANQVFSENPGMEVVGVEFGEGDPGKVKSIVLDYLERFGGEIDGIWTDYGGVSKGAYEAFVDYGAEVPPITAEDFNGWLKVWDEEGLESISPNYPTYQWRTPVIAAVMILNGEEVPKEWILPQPSITAETLAQFVRHDLPDGHFAMSGLPEEVVTELWAGQE
jgi:ribose transport system substrate-binding protein